MGNTCSRKRRSSETESSRRPKQAELPRPSVSSVSGSGKKRSESDSSPNVSPRATTGTTTHTETRPRDSAKRPSAAPHRPPAEIPRQPSAPRRPTDQQKPPLSTPRPNKAEKKAHVSKPRKTADRTTDRTQDCTRTCDEDANNNNNNNTTEAPGQKFVAYVLNTGVAGIRTEFEEIRSKTAPTREQCVCFHSTANAAKNRYKDVPCPDASRVLLKEPSLGTDFIHANYCAAPSSPHRFICTQGPLPNTLADFWSMIWHEGSEYIVMLCNFNEMGKVKCAPYFPMLEKETFLAGNAVITCDAVFHQKWPGEITVRRLTLERADEPAAPKRTITHVHWESWPDRGVPPVDATLTRLLQTVCRSAQPIVVHCSAGIGRTGTTVAIQIVTELVAAGKTMEAGLGGLLVGMRKQRAGSVQNDQQYVFVHRLLLERYISEEAKNSDKYANFVKDYDAMMT